MLYHVPPPKKTILWINYSDLTATPLEMMGNEGTFAKPTTPVPSAGY